jgi:hypothetical protein
MKRFHLLVCACLLLCLFAATSPLYGQATGRISGTISDSTGAVIPGAAVTITNLETGRTWTKTTDENGYYVQTQLPVGPYKVEAEAAGFQKAAKTGYDLAADGRLTADFALKVGAVSETVQVTEVLGETVNTVSGEVGHTIDSEQVQDLALNGRNYLELLTLIPGVALLDEDQMARTTSLNVYGQTVNGNRLGSNHLMVDGGMNLDASSNGSQINNVGVDFIREMRVQSSAFSAEYGRNSGASINVVTKSGGDKFHGGLLETLRNDRLDARNYFSPQKPSFRYNDYGWNLGGPIKGGPIKKGKLFFFAGQEWKKIRRYTDPTRRTMPTRAERQGFFADRTNTIRYPASMYPTPTNVPNKDLSSLMTTDGKAIMKVYDAMEKYTASYVDTPTSNNATFQVLNPFNSREDILRIDWRAGDRHWVYGRWIHDSYDLIDPFGTFNASSLPTTPTARKRPGSGPQLADIWTISPRVINEARINGSWHSQRTPLLGDNWKRSTYGFQFPVVFSANGPYPGGIPDVTVSGISGFNGPARVFSISPTTDIAMSDSLTYMRGRHTIKTGVTIVRNRGDGNTARSVYDGSVAFNTSGNTNSTNYALADVVVGNFQTYTEAASDPIGMFRFSQYEGYIQDSWKVTSRFSIEVGMRFSRFIPTYTTGNNMASFDPSLYNPAQAVTVTAAGVIVPNSGNPLNGLVRAGDGVPKDQIGRVAGATSPEVLAVPAGAPRGFYIAPAILAMPRFSFAWAPFRASRTAVRGGFGTFHDRVKGNVLSAQINVPPFSKQVSFESGNLSSVLGGTASALAVMGSINSIDRRLKVPVVYTYNLGVQRELKYGFFLDATYAGNLGHHLLRQPDINFPSFAVLSANQLIPSAQRPVTNAIRPYKGYSSIRMSLSDANSNYNALQTYLTRRKGNAVLTVSYTWSHALADASYDTDNPDSGLEYTNRRFFYGPPTFDRRHVFVATYTYRIPLLRNRHDFLGAAFGRWEVSGIVRKQSGSPLTPVGSAIVTRRADYIGGDVELPADQRTPNHWFNTAAFKTAPNDRLGNAGVGIIRGPGLVLSDISLRKEFRIHEPSWVLKFQADAFNLANHPNFRSLSVTTSDSAFGSFSACGPARSIQFGLKFNF